MTFLYTVTGTNAEVGLLQAASGLASLAAALPVGWAADKFRRSRVIAIGGVTLLLAIGALLQTRLHCKNSAPVPRVKEKEARGLARADRDCNMQSAWSEPPVCALRK